MLISENGRDKREFRVSRPRIVDAHLAANKTLEMRVERRNARLPADPVWCTLRAHLSLRVFIARRVFDLASVCYAL